MIDLYGMPSPNVLKVGEELAHRSAENLRGFKSQWL